MISKDESRDESTDASNGPSTLVDSIDGVLRVFRGRDPSFGFVQENEQFVLSVSTDQLKACIVPALERNV